MWTLRSTTEAEGSAGNCRQPLFGGSSLPFSLLLQLSQEFSHNKLEIPNKTFIVDFHLHFICSECFPSVASETGQPLEYSE